MHTDKCGSATEAHGKHGKNQMEEEELTFKIRGRVYEVFLVLGAGFLEQVYQQALLHELEVQGLKAEG
jgi:hypothetical protein